MRKISFVLSCAASLLWPLSLQANVFQSLGSGGGPSSGLPSISPQHQQFQNGLRGPANQDPENFGGAQNRSERIKNCEVLVNMPQRQINGPYVNNPNLYSVAIPLIMKHALGTDTTASGAGAQGTQDEQAIQKTQNALYALADQIAFCEAYRVSLTPQNYNENYDEFEGDGANAAKSEFGAAGLECANQPTQEAQATCMERAKEEGGMGCSHEGAETHDYLACKRIVKFMDGFVIGKQVMQVQQTFRAGAKQMELQDEITQKARSEEGVQITDGMKVQAESTRQQGNLAYEMAAFDGAKAGVLLSMIADFPNPEKMIEKCKTNSQTVNKHTITTDLVNNITKYFGEESTISIDQNQKALLLKAKDDLVPPPFDQDETNLICAQAITTNANAGGGENFLFLNQEVRDKMKAVAMKAGLEALANGAKGALLHDQAGMIDDAMKDIEEFEPPEFPVAEELPATASECLVDPSAEGCIAPAAGGFDGFTGQNFNASFGGGANLGSGTEEGGLSDTDSSVTGATDRNLLPTNFGTVDGVNTTGNDFVDGQARAGSIKAGQVAAGGGGGGGSAGGGGGFGGGGGANKGPQQAKPSGKRDINIKTKGTGLATVGGRGAIGASKKKATNPFSKLLGKNKTKGNSSLNFRGPAQVAGKKGSLFQMISNRYNSVSAKDRLLKYENKN